ncbi:vacuolar protein sorting-associated protein Vps17 [Nadsonia fulvescens var. elongata DSM 6958]|uniref:Vacuolar protein sorting-associated protein 17 n=1 Tax=Nadsonia fulvescens var. elongata DSM 6958 TaxID=857566 RepID=A0A1E3PSL6_9ASCO|nr:vacuolar protein sorting-associated protein Vps17 [Nadsonia fulvescens var. elongata DSM 6958]
MASSIPYMPDGFGPESNPFSQPYEDNNPLSEPVEGMLEPESETTPKNDKDHIENYESQGNDQPKTNDDGIESTTQGLSNVDLSDDTPISASKSKNVSAQSGIAKSPVAKPRNPISKYRLTTKITGIEQNNKKSNPIIKFDAYTNLPRFRTTTFREIRRTYNELKKFFEYLDGANPECFVPAVPPCVTSAGIGTEENDIKVKRNLQIWLDRITSNLILMRDEEMVHFIESDFGYFPVVRKRPPATGLKRKAMKQLSPPHDEVTELHEFRPIVKQIFVTGEETFAKLEKLSKVRRNAGLAMNDFGSRVKFFAGIESSPAMKNMWNKLSKIFITVGDIEAMKSTAEMASLGDGINMIAQDAYVAKEALTNRHLLMKELERAQIKTKECHKNATRIKSSANISPVKVDEAISELKEAASVEEDMTNKLRRVTDSMLLEKQTFSKYVELDMRSYLAEYTKRMIESERITLSAWESIRGDIRAPDLKGGLSRLGRESVPISTSLSHSISGGIQGTNGDNWSGTRATRVIEKTKDGLYTDRYAGVSKDEIPQDDIVNDRDDEPSTMDARNAASLLGGSTF